MIDLFCRQILMSAYLYYRREQPVISDAENDFLCETVADSWSEVPLRYKPLLDPDNTGGESLRASTHQCQFTRQVEGGALAWLREKKNIMLAPLATGHLSGQDLETQMAMYELM